MAILCPCLLKRHVSRLRRDEVFALVGYKRSHVTVCDDEEFQLYSHRLLPALVAWLRDGFELVFCVGEVVVSPIGDEGVRDCYLVAIPHLDALILAVLRRQHDRLRCYRPHSVAILHQPLYLLAR